MKDERQGYHQELNQYLRKFMAALSKPHQYDLVISKKRSFKSIPSKIILAVELRRVVFIKKIVVR